ncbi:MAG: formylglycine-generating enzyme family protein [Bacteroidia bacterium]
MVARFLHLLCFTAALVSMSVTYGNNLRVSNVSVDQVNGTVTFDLAWDNSWRIDGVGTPNHWDAAWVFVKWRDCGATPTTGWTHGLINTSTASHTFGQYQPTLSDGSAIGIDAGPNNTGVMLRQNTTGLYPARGASSVTLDLTNYPVTGDFDVRVFGVEMVFVPQGDFILGGNGTTENYPFNQNGQAFPVTEDTALTLRFYSSNSYITTLPAAYPVGWNPFYCMKYEITQGQYADFLNTADAATQSTNFLNSFNSYRNRLTSGGTPPFVYFSDRPDRACNYLSWTDMLAYLDWSCLRPMTETEYEKATRGQGPYVGGFAWGSTDITEAQSLSSPEDGTEVVLNPPNANAIYDNTTETWAGGDGGQGPARVGILATAATTSRLQTGASYYGIMEMSGNLWEQCVMATSDVVSLAYDGAWGDGYLDANGYADVANWPYRNTPFNTGSYLRQLRGGSYADTQVNLRIANRYYFLGYSSSNNRARSIGGRGVR